MDDLYREELLDHYHHPHHVGTLDHAAIVHRGFNPSCGDEVTWTIAVDDAGKITDVAWQGSGCVISQASISILSDALIGKKVADIKAMTTDDIFGLLGGEIVETRLNCALLGIRTVQEGLATAETLPNSSTKKP